MKTITLTNGQVSQITFVPAGSRITSSGNGSIEWTPGTEADARNAPNWKTWSKGSASGFMDTVRPMSIRATATGNMTVTIDEDGADKYGADVYFEESQPYFSTDANGNPTVIVGPRGNAGFIDIGLFGASPTATAAVNTAAIQAALTQTGLVTLKTPGTYLVNPGMLLYSNTTLELGKGVVLKQANGVENNIFNNSNWKSPLKAVSSITDAATSPVLTGSRLVTVDCGVVAHNLVAGNYALIRGDTTRRYNGIHEVISATTTTWTFYASKKTAIGAAAGTLTCERADANITITGGGTIDFNGFNNQSAYDNSAHLMVFSKIKNLHLGNINLLNATKFCAFIVNSQNTVVDNVYVSSASDGIHFHAFTLNPKVTNIRGESGDDFLVWTANHAGYETYNFLNTDGTDSMSAGGDCLGLEFTNIYPDRSGEDVVALYAIGTNALEGVVIDGFGTNTDSANCLFVCATGGGGPAGTAVKDITLRNMRGIGRTNNILISRATDTNGVTIDKLDVSGIYPNGTYALAEGLLMFNRATINKLVVEPRSKMTFDVSAARYFMQTGAFAVLPDVTVVDYECSTSGSGNFHSTFAGSGALTNVNFIRPRLAGSSQLLSGSFTGTPKVTIDNWYDTNGRLAWVNFNCRLEIKNGKCGTPGGTPPLAIYGSATVDVVAHGNDWGNATNWLQVGTAAGDTVTCNLYFGNHASAVGFNSGINWVATAPTVRLRASDGSLPIDAAKFTSINSGAVYYNNNAAYSSGVGLYTYGATVPAKLPTIAFYSQSLDVASVAAITSAEQTFTVTGLTTDDRVFVNKPTLTAGLGVVNARVSAADTLALTFMNATAAAIDPAAEIYEIVAIRK